MKGISFHIAVSTAVVLVGVTACSSERDTVRDLDASLRGRLSPEIWAALPAKSKHLRCLQYKISSMRKLVSEACGPVELLDYYPRWAEGLADCAAQYPINEKSAEQLREAVTTEMAKVLGEEVSSYLTYQRLHSSEPPEKWLDKWRTFAIVGIAGVSKVLPEEP